MSMVQNLATDPRMVQRIIASLKTMKPEQLEEFGAAHKSDPFIFPLVFNESNLRERVDANQQMQAGEPEPVNEQALQKMRAEDVGIAQLPMGDSNYAEGGIVAFADGGKPKADPVQEFATKYRSLAEQAGAELGVDPGLIIAQWGHETGWGRGVPGKNNLGNIKGKGTSAYDSIEKSRSQYKNYDSPEAFMQDYVSQIKRNFPSAVGAGGDVGQFTKGLQKGRLGAYASDPAYAKKMASAVSKVLPMGSAQAEETAPAPAAEPAKTGGATTADLRALRKSSNLGDKVDTVGQVARSVLQNPLARIAGGLSGLAGAVLPGPEGQGADYAQRVENYLGYRPDAYTEDSKKILGVLGAPLALANKYVANPAGDYLAEEGLPALGAIVRGVPEAGLSALGLKLASAAKAKGAAAPAATTAAPAAAAATAPVRTVPTPAQMAAANTATPAIVGPPLPPFVGPQRPFVGPLPPTAAQQAAGLVGPPRPTVAQRAAPATTAAVAPAAAAAAAAAAAPVSRMAAARAAIGEGAARVGKGLPALVPALAAVNPGAVENAEPFSTGEYQGKSGDPDVDVGPLTPATEKKITDAAKATMTPEERKESGLSGEDWLNLGFSLLASKSPQFTEALGRAGLDTLAGKTARTKAGLDALKTNADIAQSGAMSRYYGAAADRYSREDKPQLAYQKALDDAVSDLDKNLLYQFAKPAERLAMENAARVRARANFLAANPELASTIGGAGGKTGNPLVDKYLQ